MGLGTGMGFRLAASLCLSGLLTAGVTGAATSSGASKPGAGDGERRAGRRPRRQGPAGVPGLLGPERGGRLPVDAQGRPGPAPPGLGPQRADVRAAGRTLRRRLRPDTPGPAQPRRSQALQAAGRRGGARPAQRLVQRAGPLRAGPLQAAWSERRRRLAAERERRLQQQPDLHRVRGRQPAQRLRRRHRDGAGRLPPAEQRSPGGVVRTQLQDLLHRLRPHHGGRRAAPRRRHRRAGATRHDGRGAQRRPAGPHRGLGQRAPLRPCVVAGHRGTVPRRGVPARQGAGVDVRQGPVLPRRHRGGSRRAAATPSAATSAIPPSSG